MNLPQPNMDGSVITHKQFNQLPAEIQYIITSSGITLAAATDQLAKALANYAARANFYIGSGTTVLQILTVQSGFPAHIAYSNGMTVHWRPSVANVGNTNLKILPDLAEVDLVKESSGAELSNNNCVTTKDSKARYNGVTGKFLLIGV